MESWCLVLNPCLYHQCSVEAGILACQHLLFCPPVARKVSLLSVLDVPCGWASHVGRSFSGSCAKGYYFEGFLTISIVLHTPNPILVIKARIVEQAIRKMAARAVRVSGSGG